MQDDLYALKSVFLIICSVNASKYEAFMRLIIETFVQFLSKQQLLCMVVTSARVLNNVITLN